MSNEATTIESPAPLGLTPLCIVGLPRGGANAVRELLNRHPQINIGYNLRTFSRGPALYRRTKNLDQTKPFYHFLDKLAWLEGNSIPRAWLVNVFSAEAERLYEAHRAKPAFSTIIETAFRLANPKLLVYGDKCTHPNTARDMLQMWPNTRIISVIRDPRGGAYAFCKHDKRQRLRYAAMHWNMHVDWTAELNTRTSNLLLIQYEQFGNDLPKLCGHLLRFAGVNDPPFIERFAQERHSDRSIADQWRVQLEPHEQRAIEQICFSRMKSLGYKPDLARRERLPNIAQRALECALQWLADRRARTKLHKPHLAHTVAPTAT